MFENIGKGDYTIPGDCGPPLSDLLRGEALGTAPVGLEVLGMGCQGVMGVLGVPLESWVSSLQPPPRSTP